MLTLTTTAAARPRRSYGTIWLLVAVSVLAYVIAVALWPITPHFSPYPVSRVAPEVCEHNGPLISAQREDSTPWLFVTCSDNVVRVLHR